LKKAGVLLMALCFLCGFEPSVAFGGRPLVTEDAGTVEKGFFEVELAFDSSQDNNRDRNYIPSIQLAYGLTDRSELALAGSYLFKDVYEGGREDGWGDGIVYLKYRIWGEGEKHPAFALKPHVKIPTADEKRGLGSGKPDYGLTAVFSKSITGMNWHLNVGYTLIGKENTTDEFNLALAGEYEIRKGLLAVSEIRYTYNLNSDRNDDPASILLGLQASVGKVLLDAGLSLGLNTAAPDYALTVGVTIKFH
jgi:hypothetical protein